MNPPFLKVSIPEDKKEQLTKRLSVYSTQVDETYTFMFNYIFCNPYNGIFTEYLKRKIGSPRKIRMATVLDEVINHFSDILINKLTSPPPIIQFIDGVEQNKLHPETFEVPTKKEQKDLRVGDLIKIGILLKEGNTSAERPWAEVTAINTDGSICAKLQNDMVFTYIHSLILGDEVLLQRKNLLIIHHQTDDWENDMKDVEQFIKDKNE